MRNGSAECNSRVSVQYLRGEWGRQPQAVHTEFDESDNQPLPQYIHRIRFVSIFIW